MSIKWRAFFYYMDIVSFDGTNLVVAYEDEVLADGTIIKEYMKKI